MNEEFEIGTEFYLVTTQIEINIAEETKSIPSGGLILRENLLEEKEGYYMDFIQRESVWGGVLIPNPYEWDEIEKSKYDALMLLCTHKLVVHPPKDPTFSDGELALERIE